MTALLALYKFTDEAEALAHDFAPLLAKTQDGSWHPGNTLPDSRILVPGPPDADGNPAFVPLPYWYVWIGVVDLADVIPPDDSSPDPALMAVVDIMGPSNGETKEQYIKWLAAPLQKADMLTVYRPEPMPW